MSPDKPATHIKDKIYAQNLMTINDVTKFCNKLKEIGVKVWIDGGWDVDALIGQQTRSHGDLDIAIEMKDV